MARARRVLTAVSNGRGLCCTWASRSPPWSVASRVSGEVVRVDARRKLPVGMKGSEPIADGGCPLIEPCRDERSGLGVTLGELTNERAKLAAPLCFGALRCGDHHVPPGFDSVRAAERVPLAIDDGLGLVVDDRLHEVVLVGKVVVHLRAADSRRHLDVFQGGARHSALMDQCGGVLHYSCPGACSLGGELRPVTRFIDHAPMLTEILSLTTQSSTVIVSCATHFRREEEQRMTDLSGKTALVTGSTSGIGKATATALAARGAHVLIVGRNEQRAKDVVAEIEGSGGSATFLLTSLSDLKSAQDLVEWATEAGGGHVDILINNAGVALLGPSNAATEAAVRRDLCTERQGSVLPRCVTGASHGRTWMGFDRQRLHDGRELWTGRHGHVRRQPSGSRTA